MSLFYYLVLMGKGPYMVMSFFTTIGKKPNMVNSFFTTHGQGTKYGEFLLYHKRTRNQIW